MQAESEADRAAWVSVLQGTVAELITLGPKRAHGGGAAGAAVAAMHASADGSNAACADCGEPEPDWASLNLGCVLCQQCAGSHRSLGTHVSKVRSVALDADSWAPAVSALFHALGNAQVNAAWEGSRRQQEPPQPLVPKGAALEERLALIRSKYADHAFVLPVLREAAQQPGALAQAAGQGQLTQLMALLAGGANAAGAEGAAALCAAARLGDAGAPLAAALLFNGAEPAATDEAGTSATDVALNAGAAADGTLVTLLASALAKRQ